MVDYWIVGMSLYGCLVFLLLVNLSLRMAIPKERSLWVCRMIFTTYVIQLVGLWAFSTFSSTVSASLFAIGGFSFIFMTLFMSFFIVAIFAPRETSARNGMIFFYFRLRLLGVLSWAFGD